MRVGIVGLLHESNTFHSEPTTRGHFTSDVLVAGDALRERFSGAHHEIGGFLAGCERAGIEAVPIFAARAVPFGPITDDTFEGLWADLADQWNRAGKLDGVLAAAHGAAVSGGQRDADGEWLSRLRALAGPMPIVATLDAHANLSARMVRAVDALIAYRTNPHLDQRERGEEAAAMIARTLRGEVKPVMDGSFPPMVINIERQCTSDPHWRFMHEAVEDFRRREGVLSASLLLGFPYADVREMGASIVVVTDNDARAAREAAATLGRALWRERSSFLGQGLAMEGAIEEAARSPGPVGLLDMGDNIGGGAPGDATLLIEQLRKGSQRAFACICDPIAARRAADAGTGASLELAIGGRSDPSIGSPMVDRFRVVRLDDGRFIEREVRHGGASRFDQGLTALLEDRSGHSIVVTSLRVPPFSLGQLTSCGVDPSRFHALVIKGVHAPIAAYRETCRTFLRVDTPGITSASMDRFVFRRRRAPLFPFEPDAVWNDAAD
ncbi:MAG: M81 family metallopeptidase [Planctomycetes bacterium]|nr:M81 family metallopeptidase [Planctomycetota bacterium]